MIDVKELIAKYSIEELIEAAEAYYASSNLDEICRKPFILPYAQHLLAEVGHLIAGLRLVDGDRVLDFGCGVGWTSRILNLCGCDVIGMDVSESALRAGRVNADAWSRVGGASRENAPKLEFARFDGRTLDIADASVDKIFVLDAFHHVPNPKDVLTEFGRVLRPGGVAGFCEAGPNHSRSEASQREMRMHKVIENDIVLDDLWAHAKTVGFDELRVCVSPLLPMIVDYEDYLRFPNEPTVVSQFISGTAWRVHNYPIFFLRRAGEAKVDSRLGDGLSARLELLSARTIEARVGEPVVFRLGVTNTGFAVWLPSGGKTGSVNIGVSIACDGRSADHRAFLSGEGVQPGERIEVDVTIPGGLPAGSGSISVDLVAENVAWFDCRDVNGVGVTVAFAAKP